MEQHGADECRRTTAVRRLVVAARAGDEVVGCGGLLARHARDTAVVVLAAADGVRLEQARTAHRLLGDPPASMLGLTARQLSTDLDRLVGLLDALIGQIRPAEVYLPYPALDLGHLIAYEAGLRSTTVSSVRGAGPRPAILLYGAGDFGPEEYPADIRWGVHEALDAVDVNRKVAAARAYEWPSPHLLKEGAASVGARAGLPWAEQFALVRSQEHAGHRDEVVRARLVPAGAPR
jgi:N-acetylglucosamine malate deacetylase 1